MASMQRRIAASAAAAGLLAQLLPITGAAAADPVTQTFLHTGAEQLFVVPSSVTSLHVVLVGGRGGDYVGAPIIGGLTTGGSGGRVEGDLAVTGGATLYIEVGGNGLNVTSNGNPTPGGFNGGGAGGECMPAQFFGASGGGASDIRVTPRAMPGTLNSRLVVAGGGGGAGDVANGGAAGAAGAGPRAGGAGTSAAGGAGGFGDVNGGNGSLGQGGAGASSVIPCAGAGGGGYFGGGGGGVILNDPISGGSGGGGSSAALALTNPVVGIDATGAPSVTISYTGFGDSGNVAAEVDVPASAACLELSTTAIDFGTQRFGAEKQPASPTVTVTNCSSLTGRLLASGTDATGTGAQWTLVDAPETCADTLGLDRYRLDLAAPEWLGDSLLGKLPSPFVDLAPGQSSEQTVKITMPCPGSSGGGQTMSMSINYLVVEQ